MNKISDLGKEDLEGKKVLLRVDFNVSFSEGGIGGEYRIKAHKDTIDSLLSHKARVALVSHISGSFKEIIKDIGRILDKKLEFEEDILTPKSKSQLILFENIRRYEGEEKNDEDFARNLAKNFDIYVNDAFSVSHRNHSSVSSITRFLPSYAGLLFEKEIANLEKVLNEPREKKIVVLGGAKISTKIPVIANFMDKAEKILIGGALANTIFKFKGLKVGQSLVENSGVEEVLKKIDLASPQILLPEDFAVSDDKTGKSIPEIGPVQDIDDNQFILDIGPETAERFSEIIKDSRVVIFNGPLGLAEVEIFSLGTKVVLDSIIRSSAFTVIGGGDTLALLEKFDFLDKFGYVSTGGGAMLEFLAGARLPGLEALTYYE